MLFYVNRAVFVIISLWLIYLSVKFYGLDTSTLSPKACIFTGFTGAMGLFISLLARRENL
jgi:hypothetical protein